MEYYHIRDIKIGFVVTLCSYGESDSENSGSSNLGILEYMMTNNLYQGRKDFIEMINQLF